MFTVLLDTCVLRPSLQRDLFLSLAIEGVYRPVWSAAILEELEYHEADKLGKRGVESDEAEKRARRLISQMRKNFDDAEVSGWEPLEGSFDLPDPDDEHVVAAAVVAHAGAIVTDNLRDFPTPKLPADLHVLPAAGYAFTSVGLDPVGSLQAIRKIAERSGRLGRAHSIEDVLTVLEQRYAMTEAVKMLRAM